MNDKENFQVLSYYGLRQDKYGNIVLSNDDDIVNARRARVDMLLANIEPDDINFVKLETALRKRFMDNHELLAKFDEEDKEIARQQKNMLEVLNNLDDLSSIDNQDLLSVSISLSELSYIGKNVVLSSNSELTWLKEFCCEKKQSGEVYSDQEYEEFVEHLDKINNLIKLELYNRIKDHDKL